jgi:prepilin-type N-terminal cleavage/methylation domain-containing protein
MKLRRRLAGDEGFTLVEAMVSITILAVGAFAIAQSMMFGLGSTGLSRQRLASRAALDQQMEEARALNYDNLVLSDATALTHSSNADNPDYWVNQAAQTYDADHDGSGEAIVRVAGASPALEHYQNPYVNGETTYEVYRYVTWYDSPQDGTGGSDAADGNGDGTSDANGHDAKRVTVVVVWRNVVTGDTSTLSESSLFSDGAINYHAPTKNSAPTVACPLTSISGLTATFTASASDADGSIASVSWTFGDGNTGTGVGPLAHTYAASGTYNVVTSVVDNGGSTASNSAAGCSVTVTNPVSGIGGPDGTVQINANATYANSIAVTLTIAKSGGQAPDTFKLSNDGTTWSSAYAWPNGASFTYSWTMSAGADGPRTVYARFFDSSNNYGSIANDTITLDSVGPGAPTAFHKTTSTTTGANTTSTFVWTAPVGVTDLGGYRMYSRLITSTGAFALVCDTSTTSCSDTHKKTDTYEYYVVAYDLATNVSAHSATPNPTG